MNYFKTINEFQHFEPKIKAEAAKTKVTRSLPTKSMVTKLPNVDILVAPRLMMPTKQHAKLVENSTKAKAGQRKAMPDAMAPIAKAILSTNSKRTLSNR